MHQEHAWTEQALERLPVKSDFRLRGLDMTRLETFADAAFAFAVTMLIISIDTMPGNLGELKAALKGVPAFAASFALVCLVWAGHNRWSRRYGLEDGVTTLLTLALIFIMLVYLYPLKLVFSAMFAWVSNGWLPSEFAIDSAGELAALFVVYGIGFTAVSAVIALLYAWALRMRSQLGLNALERHYTRGEVVGWSIMAITGVLSTLTAWLMPGDLKAYAGFVYFILPVAMPWNGIHFERRALKLQADAPAREGERI